MKSLLLILFSLSAFGIEFKGFIKSIPQYSKDQQQLDNSFRLRMLYEASDHFSTEWAYGINFKYIHGNNNLIQSSLSQNCYRIVDIETKLLKNSTGSEFNIIQNLDRLNINLSGERIDISIGRQAISFGSARIVNSIDFLVPYSFNSLDVENRYGVDAFRLRYTLGEMGEFDLGYVAGAYFLFDESVIFASIRYPIFNGWDFLFLYSYFKENHLLGIDWQAEIKGAGVWLEMSYRKMHDDEKTIHVSVGLEYRFNDEFSIFSEYHHNGSGVRDQNLYLGQLQKASYSDGGIYNLAKNYLGIGANYLPMPLINLSFIILENLDDGSLMVRPMTSYNAANDVTIDLGALLGLGSAGSEYSLYDRMVYLAIKYYF